MSFANSSLKRQ